MRICSYFSGGEQYTQILVMCEKTLSSGHRAGASDLKLRIRRKTAWERDNVYPWASGNLVKCCDRLNHCAQSDANSVPAVADEVLAEPGDSGPAAVPRG